MAAPMSGFGPPDVNAQQQATMPSPEMRHPVRPSWNPAEEARRRAEVEQVALEHFESKRRRKREVPEPTSSMSLTSIAAMSQAHAEEAEHLSDRHFPTVVPRAICVTGFFLGFAFPAVFLWLNQIGHNELVDGHFHPDEMARRVMVIVLGGAALCLLFGWLWWGVAAALNARRTTRWAVSPWYVPLTYVAVYVAGVGAGIAERWLGDNVVYARACALAFGVVMYFSTLTTFRGTAQALGGTTKYFTRLIVVPWFVAAGVGVFLFFADYLASQALLGAFVLLQLVQGLYGLTMYQAMASVDRSSVGTSQMRPDDQEFAKFLKLAR
jgi:hypothetical protein